VFSEAGFSAADAPTPAHRAARRFHLSVLGDSILYVMVSDAAEDATIDLSDKLTCARLSLRLPAQHAVIGKREKGVVTKYDV
jgi:hypothetical protein